MSQPRRRILITGAGGSPAVNFTRSLRAASFSPYLVGTDADKYYLQRAEVDARYLAPSANHPRYIDFLNHVIEKERIEFIHAQNDVELAIISANRSRIDAQTYLPAHSTVLTLQDKFESFRIWDAAGIKVPRTLRITRETDLDALLELLGGSMWIRAISGAGGRGSLPVHDVKTAKNWLDFHEGNGSWDGEFTASELLQPETVTWMSLWHQGTLVSAQGRKRLSWELAKVSPSGVTGATGTGLTYSSPALDALAQQTILAIDKAPHGLFGVDFAYDQSGIPNPTEINVGRFFTTHEFFTCAGFNMPEQFVNIGLSNEFKVSNPVVNPIDDGLLWIRGIDFRPTLTSTAATDALVDELNATLRAL